MSVRYSIHLDLIVWPTDLGSLYRFKKPDVNMALPPSELANVRWCSSPRHVGQRMDPRSETHGSPAWINGVKVQDDVELPNTRLGAGEQEEPILLPTFVFRITVTQSEIQKYLVG